MKRNYLLTIIGIIFSSNFSLVIAAENIAVVDTTQVQSKIIQELEVFPGTVISKSFADIAIDAQGLVNFIEEEGAYVQAGQTIALIDTSKLSFKLDQAKADLKEAIAKLNFYDKQYLRLSTLSKTNSTAVNMVEQTVMEREVAESEKQRVEASIELIILQIDRARVQATFSGVLAKRYVHKGEYLKHGDSIARLIAPEEVEVSAFIPSEMAKKLKLGSEMTIFAGEEVIKGSLRAYIPQADAKSRHLEVRGAVVNGSLAIGSAIKVQIELGKKRDALLVPREALLISETKTFVVKLDLENSVEKIVVHTGISFGNMVEIKGQLNRGDRVIIKGGFNLVDGQKVNPSS